MGWRHWTMLGRKDHISQSFMNGTGTGRGEGHSHFTSQCIQRQRKTQGKCEPELDLKKEQQQCKKDKDCTWEEFWKLSQVQGAWKSPSPWEWNMHRFKQIGIIAGCSSLQILPAQSQQRHWIPLALYSNLKTIFIGELNFPLHKMGQSMEQKLPDFWHRLHNLAQCLVTLP